MRVLCMCACMYVCMYVHACTKALERVCVFLTCCSVVTLRTVEFAPVGGIKMPMCIGLGVAATVTHKIKMLVGLQLRLKLV
jgi:hypothetical protein